MLRSLTRLGLVRGLLGGNRGWLALGVAATGFRVLGKMIRKEPKVVYSEELEPGQMLVVTHLRYHVK